MPIKSQLISLISRIRIVSSTVALAVGLSACGGINGGDGVTILGIIPPVAPTAPILTVAGSDQIDITWAAVANTTSYQLYRHTSNAAGSATLIASPITLSHSDTGLTNNTSYYYWLKACNANGCSDFSPTASDITAQQTPAAALFSATTLAQGHNVHAEIGTLDTLIKYYTTETIGYYRTTEKDCDLANYNLCTNSILEPFPANSANNPNKVLSSFMDNYMTLDNLITNPQPTYVHLVTSNQTLTFDVSVDPPHFLARSSHQSVVLNNEIYVIGGYNDNSKKNDVWKSSDGVNWTEMTPNAGFSARYKHQAVVLNNEIYVIGGYNDNSKKNDVWKSSDGVNWTEMTPNAGFSARYDHQLVVLNNEIYVIGGYNDNSKKNDVWKSSDGVNWTEMTPNAGFSARYKHQAVVLNNEIYVIGGYNDNSKKNDVWKSSDGVNWTEMTPNAGFSARYKHQAVVLNNEIYVIGGHDGTRTNDVWKSSDGANWTEITASANFSVRSSHQAVALNDKIYVIGGHDGTLKNDVWKYYPSSTDQEWRLLRAIHAYQE